MAKEQGAWFEQPGRFLDPGLVRELKRLREIGADEENEAVPVIVSFHREAEDSKREEVLNLCRDGSCNTVDGELKLLGGFHGKVRPGTLRELSEREEVRRIYYDREVRAFLDVARKSSGVADVQAQEGLTGKNVTIAVIDTGVYPHDDLMKPDSRIIAFADLVNGREEPYDDQGHGTHCAGDAAGNGYRSEGLYAGPAAEANIVGVKVLDANGSGQLSTVIKGVEWCVENREKYGIRILSLSLGAPAYESYRDDPLAQAAEVAWHHGIVVCAAAGNEGPYPGTISTPGFDPVIITVGAADDRNTVDRADDVKAPYSSRGPTIDLLVKPDVYAPGTHIISLSVPGSPIEEQLPENMVNEHYISLSGTSMATPFCAGVAALLLEANPRLSPNDVKAILMHTAQEMEGDQAGYLDVRPAVSLAKEYRNVQEATLGMKS
ncbi:serine protease AprX [Melghirimyces profundicolus]|uniref:Serine protease AprX n=1 Tax=Melghirimyces profundicolus TaxID=1242148 RepID=A0A2T6BXD1_9BACL|nr:S8 family peptidase [Melghirimyces profundicolus]PTX60741.1 serine protease AprX [Melghirimyces profundicolus]